jgi:hypothetical protein
MCVLIFSTNSSETFHILGINERDVVKKVYWSSCKGPGSSVSIATVYRLDGPGIESRWGRDFSHMSGPALGPTQPPVQWVPGIFQGKAAGARC